MTGTIDPVAERALLSSIMAQVVDGGGAVIGAAFAVAPDILVTSAHVLDDGAVGLRPLGSTTSAFDVLARFSERPTMPHLAPWPDLAILRIDGHRFVGAASLDSRLPSVPTSLRMIGFPPAGGASNLDILTATLDSEGGAGSAPMLRLVGAQVEGGVSGGPLICPSSRTVVGVVLATKDPDQPNGGFGVGMAALHARWPTGAGPWPGRPADDRWVAAYSRGVATQPPVRATSRLRANDPHFIGRQSLIDQLEQTGDAPTVIRALGGSGGVGKSELALWWAHRCRADGRHAVVWWVDATSEATTHAGLLELARAIGAEPGEDLEATAAAVDAALGMLTDRWLVVFDNADTLDHLRGSLPTAEGGMALVTTRSTTAGATIDAVEIDIGVFSDVEAASYLLDSVRSPLHGADDGVTARIADRLGYLPLALAQAASFMNERSMSFTDYERLIASDLPQGLEISAARHERTVATLWDHILPLLSSEARQIVRHAAVIAPRNIPVKLVASVGIDPSVRSAAVEEAARFRVVTITGIAGPQGADTFDMHQLTQLAAAGTDDESQASEEEMTRRCAIVVRGLDPENSETWPLWERLDAHIDHLVHRGHGRGPIGRDAAVRLAVSRRLRGRYNDAVALLTELEGWVDEQGDDDELLAIKWELAIALRQAGRSREAVEIQDAIVAGMDDANPSRTAARLHLAVFHRAAGDAMTAIAIYEDVLRSIGEVDEPRTDNGRRAWSGLATCHRDVGRLPDAIARFEELLVLLEGQSPVNEDALASLRQNLAACYWDVDRVGEAIELEEAVLAHHEAVYGSDHPDTIRIRSNLALSYGSAGRSEEANAILLAVAVELERRLGPTHPDAVTARANAEALFPDHAHVPPPIHPSLPAATDAAEPKARLTDRFMRRLGRGRRSGTVERRDRGDG